MTVDYLEERTVLVTVYDNEDPTREVDAQNQRGWACHVVHLIDDREPQPWLAEYGGVA